MQTLHTYVAATQHADHLSDAATSRRARRASHESSASSIPSVAGTSRQEIVLRRAAPKDAVALELLATLDSAAHPTGELLVAEVDEQIVAALPLDGGRAIADPFRPTAALVELLRLRASLLAGDGAPAGRPQRFHARLPHLRSLA